MNIIEIFTKSLFLIISFDSDLWEIIILSLYVSISALIIASILGLLIGYYIALKKFLFKSFSVKGFLKSGLPQINFCPSASIKIIPPFL